MKCQQKVTIEKTLIKRVHILRETDQKYYGGKCSLYLDLETENLA